MHRRDVGCEHRRASPGDRQPCLAQRHDQCRRVGGDPVAVQRRAERGGVPAPDHQGGQVDRRGLRAGRAEAAADHAAARLGRQIVQRRQMQHEAEPIRQRRVERERPDIDVQLIGHVRRRRRVHRRPAVAQRVQRDALHALLVDDREELVLHLGPAAADLVEKDTLRAPERGRRAQVAQAVAIRNGEAHQVVEGDQAGVVVPVLEPQRDGQPLEQRALRAAVRPDQQQRRLGRQCCQHRRVEVRQAMKAEAGEQPGRTGRYRDRPCDGYRRLTGGFTTRCMLVQAPAPHRPREWRRQHRTEQGAADALAAFVDRPASCRSTRRLKMKRPSGTRAACLLLLRLPRRTAPHPRSGRAPPCRRTAGWRQAGGLCS